VIRFTKHAQEALDKRRIFEEWVERALQAPDSAGPDPRYPERTRSSKGIAEFGGRVLRVVHRSEGDDIVVITVHFDRGARR
jgi:Domain of unknown function (DUF4258)